MGLHSLGREIQKLPNISKIMEIGIIAWKRQHRGQKVFYNPRNRTFYTEWSGAKYAWSKVDINQWGNWESTMTDRAKKFDPSMVEIM